jgi:acylphosphatase
MRARKVHYSGTVQGVGFRYTAIRLAQRFDVSGYVRNLADGRVELVAEGPDREVEAFLAAIKDAMGGFIRQIDVAEMAASGGYRGFDVAR